MPFTIVCQDITKMKVDAIVNAANTNLQRGGGVCGAIFNTAGEALLQAACDKLAPIKTGEAVFTPGFGLYAKYVIHTAGPVYRRGDHMQEDQLRSCYQNSLKRAVENHCESIAFPLISSGIYGYPKDEALQVATSAIRDFLQEQDLDIYLAVFDKVAFSISKALMGEVENYLTEHYLFEPKRHHRVLLDVERAAMEKTDTLSYKAPRPTKRPGTEGSVDIRVDHLDEPFSQTLLRMIDAKGMTDVAVYKRANLDRKLFSKIRTDKAYTPSKRTAVALAMALGLSLDETEDLLKRAGYALSPSQKFDVIIEYFIIARKYDIFEINEVLFKYDQPLLGG